MMMIMVMMITSNDYNEGAQNLISTHIGD
jgi:hypothetical protein